MHKQNKFNVIYFKIPKKHRELHKMPSRANAARVFGITEFILDIYLLRLSMRCADSITIMWSVNVFINDFTLTCRRKNSFVK